MAVVAPNTHFPQTGISKGHACVSHSTLEAEMVAAADKPAPTVAAGAFSKKPLSQKQMKTLKRNALAKEKEKAEEVSIRSTKNNDAAPPAAVAAVPNEAARQDQAVTAGKPSYDGTSKSLNQFSLLV